MFEKKSWDEMRDALMQKLPPSLYEVRDEIEPCFKEMMQLTLSKMELVTREEFDVQRKVLAKTREKVEMLEKKVAELEGKVFK